VASTAIGRGALCEDGFVYADRRAAQAPLLRRGYRHRERRTGQGDCRPITRGWRSGTR
jgi:hypothetical protein